MLPVYHSSTLLDTRLSHGFFTRQGGVSTGVYKSLNTKYDADEPAENIDENRQRIAECLDISPINLVSLKQRHTNTVMLIKGPFEKGQAPEADAMVTSIPGIALGIMTADCVPVLFADSDARIIGAAHAGWRGAASGILDNTIKAMIAGGASQGRIVAAIGPCIWQESYEVGEDLRAEFKGTNTFFIPGKRPGHWQFDLPGYVFHTLKILGVQHITSSPMDTCANPDLFFSNRRRTLLGEADYGCQLSCIALRELP